MIRLIGDTHGYFDPVDKALADKSLSSIWQVGDLGKIESVSEWLVEAKIDDRLRILPGNHDNYDFINHDPVGQSLYTSPFGYEVIDGLNVFWIKGAYSIDKSAGWTTYEGKPIFFPGRQDWWPDEELTQEQCYQCLEVLDKAPEIDLMVTHCAPEQIACMLITGTIKPSRTHQFLQRLLEYKPPRYWAFGHYHKTFTDNLFGTKFYGLGLRRTIDFNRRKGFHNPN